MGLRVYKISDYDHKAETWQFDAIRALLEKRYAGDTREESEPRDCISADGTSGECVLIGNYNIEGVELDALLICNEGVRILEFKNWGGHILARENGPWTADSMVVEGGAGGKSPFAQMRINRSRVTKGLCRLCGNGPRQVSGVIVFGQDAEIDTTQLSDSVRCWLHVCDNRRLDQIFEGLTTQQMTDAEVRQMTERLRIEEFDVNRAPASTIAGETYEPEASTDLYAHLEAALQRLPDYDYVYGAYNRVFQTCLNQMTSGVRLNLGGTFSKTDYLLKEHHATRWQVRMTNDTRVRLRNIQSLESEKRKAEQQKWYLCDLRNLCQFIALVCETEVPGSLQSLFPPTDDFEPSLALAGECMRVIVNMWDDHYIYASADDATEVKINYRDANIYQFDWSYISEILYKDAQLNVIRPRTADDGTVIPELLIFEPDYLVDVTAVARCFTNYAESPFVALINKLQPNQPTESIVLGNFAGQLLDEQLRQTPGADAKPFDESVKDFWQDNALSLLTAGVDVGAGAGTFCTEARHQQDNIRHAVENVRHAVSNSEGAKGMVEPSFFSEMLGLQGRMDYLQDDYKVLFEQKSGKGEYPYGDFKVPKAKEEHQVQILLYMLLVRYNYRDIYERNNRELSAFLLYSKYEESLKDVGFYPEMVFRALKVRNTLAWTEMLYTKDNGMRILEDLTPEMLNRKHVDNSLWTRFQRPQIAELLAPIQSASPLEKAYYFRFLTFIANEHMLSKLGNKTKENSGFAASWHDSLDDKLQAGNIYCDLTLVSPDPTTEGSVGQVTMRFAERDDDSMSNFRVGDIVVFYPYERGKEPDLRRTMVFRGTIEHITADDITLVLRAKQSDARVFLRSSDCPWAIEHDFMESSYGALYRGMHAFLSAPKSTRDLLLLQREPETDTSATPNGDYGSFNTLVTRVKQAKDLFLIIGPPGTGKTSCGLLNILKEELTEPDAAVLLLSYTNRAVDEICSKLYKEDIDFIRLGGGLSCAAEYRDHLLGVRAPACRNLCELKGLIQRTRVFVATTTAMNTNIAMLQFRQFSLAIVDEASQILEPHLIGILSAHQGSVPAIRKVVLIGDHKQLPAVVQQQQSVSEVHDAMLQDIGLKDCRLSLFERLLTKYRDNESVVYMLTRQGRMHRDIALFPNYAFYNNRLEVVPLDHQLQPLPVSGQSSNGIDNMLQTRRIAFVNVDAPADSVSDKVNQAEARVIAATVLRVYEREQEHFDAAETVGVIVPYRNQIAAVRNALDGAGVEALHDITIDTVERYQGSQRKYIVYGFTIQKYYQLNFLANNVFEDWDGSVIDRKLNVAMTRAEEHLIMVGNAALLSNNFTFYKLLAFVKGKHGYFDVPVGQYESGDFAVPDYDAVDIDPGKAVYAVSERFDEAYRHLVTQPLAEASGKGWPDRVLGRDMPTNLDAIGYGRILFSGPRPMSDGAVLTPQQQVLLYCHYLMRQNYCSHSSLYAGCREWLSAQVQAMGGRVHFVDIGCGPATGGLAFAEQFGGIASQLTYTGVDVSEGMRQMARAFVREMFADRLHCRTVGAFDALDGAFWADCSEVPSLVVLGLSYFFSCTTSQAAEQLARQMAGVMRRYPLNRYVILVQHDELDDELNSYRAFRRVLTQHVQVITEGKAQAACTLEGKEQALPFAYCIMANG